MLKNCLKKPKQPKHLEDTGGSAPFALPKSKGGAPHRFLFCFPPQNGIRVDICEEGVFKLSLFERRDYPTSSSNLIIKPLLSNLIIQPHHPTSSTILIIHPHHLPLCLHSSLSQPMLKQPVRNCNDVVCAVTNRRWEGLTARTVTQTSIHTIMYGKINHLKATGWGRMGRYIHPASLHDRPASSRATIHAEVAYTECALLLYYVNL